MNIMNILSDCQGKLNWMNPLPLASLSQRPSWNLNPNIILYTEWCCLKEKKFPPSPLPNPPCKFWLDNVLKFLLTLPSPLTRDWNFNCVNYKSTSRLFNKISAGNLDWTKEECFIKLRKPWVSFRIWKTSSKAAPCVTLSIVKTTDQPFAYALSVTINLLFNFNNNK